ncbi:hypothetical protein BV22DRAFT_412752 [Leucogyrophana mollusca]|uniref:Uncharacterized protein n=1 Tax=Leucogyrophana mollusca TaxID=85980 RepID=A0ACB8BJL6_9AGAM|nr:hypothetical protein BV22DRAFT_412752 [Leucogyrophana mollusca]
MASLASTKAHLLQLCSGSAIPFHFCVISLWGFVGTINCDNDASLAAVLAEVSNVSATCNSVRVEVSFPISYRGSKYRDESDILLMHCHFYGGPMRVLTALSKSQNCKIDGPDIPKLAVARDVVVWPSLMSAKDPSPERIKFGSDRPGKPGTNYDIGSIFSRRIALSLQTIAGQPVFRVDGHACLVAHDAIMTSWVVRAGRHTLRTLCSGVRRNAINQTTGLLANNRMPPRNTRPRSPCRLSQQADDYSVHSHKYPRYHWRMIPAGMRAMRLVPQNPLGGEDRNQQ